MVGRMENGAMVGGEKAKVSLEARSRDFYISGTERFIAIINFNRVLVFRIRRVSTTLIRPRFEKNFEDVRSRKEPFNTLLRRVSYG